MNKWVREKLRARLTVVMLAALLLALVVLFAFSLAALRPSTDGEQVALSDVLSRSEAKAISSVTFLREDSRITGVSTLDPPEFWASVPKELLPGLTDRLVTNGATVTVDDQFGKSTIRFLAQFLLPILIFATLFTLLFMLIRGGGQATSEFLRFGAVGDRRRTPERRVSYSDVGGAEDAVIEMQEIGMFLSEPAAYRELGAEPPRGVLLTGPPGCGKTLLARALATSAEVPFLYLSGAEFVESLVGIGASRVRDLFAQARELAPALVFIDELDAVGRRRGTGLGMGQDEREQTLNQLLVEIDGFDSFSGVVVIGATNRPDILDPALIRPGRFDRKIVVSEPDLTGRQQILAIHARSRKMAPGIDLGQLAIETPGLTGADLAALINEATLLAAREKRGQVTQDDLDEALERVLHGPARANRLSEDEKRRVAYHEAGHAVVAASTGLHVAVRKVSIVARGGTLGHHAAMPEAARPLVGYRQLADEVALAMAGFACENLLFGDTSTASEGDIDTATKLARRLVCLYGMSERVGPVRVGMPEEELFLGRDFLTQGQVSETLLDEIDDEVRRVLREATDTATAHLKSNRSVLDELAMRLVDVETMRSADLDAMLAGVRPAGAAPTAGNGRRTRASAKR